MKFTIFIPKLYVSKEIVNLLILDIFQKSTKKGYLPFLKGGDTNLSNFIPFHTFVQNMKLVTSYPPILVRVRTQIADFVYFWHFLVLKRYKKGIYPF